MKQGWYLIAFYLLVVNCFAFFLYGLDKYKAKKQLWRVSEKFLLLTAIIGGSVGALFGMRVFHHKTLHKKFTVGLPVILALQISLVLFFWIRTDSALFSFLF